uniref:THAP domain-containing protein 1 n=1 Tax=Neogobius melanostomus TaxID=47308 RepID=A0A8C6TP58_9GOBI
VPVWLFHCSVPRCTASARCNSMLSFFSFPPDKELRAKWVQNIRRDDLQVTSHTRVCGRHFQPADVIQPSTPLGRRRLKRGAVPLLFEWNNYSLTAHGPSKYLLSTLEVTAYKSKC